MTLILTGSPTRYGEDRFTTDNGFLDAVKAELPLRPRVLMISAAPDDKAFTDSVLAGMTLCVRNSGIEQLFDMSIISDEAGALKPSRQFFDYAFEKTGAVPSETLVIGDDPEADIAGAVDYGLKCIFFNRKHKECQYKVDAEVAELKEITDLLV